ncbi:MAG: hypothetical protein K2X39_01675 [Silvanigrellaceae bacterium]|nr:hypothetical protein [Silvanigrellaceae bacterium]
MKIIPSRQWQNQSNENLFYSDLRAMLDAVEAGEIKAFSVDRWVERQGYRLNWKNYNLEKIQEH